MMGRQGGKGTKSAMTSFSKGLEDAPPNSIFGRYSEEEMIAHVKALAMDPCRLQFAADNIQPLLNQVVGLRKVMSLEDSEIPWRKRKLEQFVKDKLKAPVADFVLANKQKRTKLSRKQLSHASSVSCLLNSVDSNHSHNEKINLNSRTSSSLVTFDDVLPKNKFTIDHSFVQFVASLNSPLKDASQTIDSDESVNGSNPQSPENPTPNAAPILEIGNVDKSDEAPRRHMDTPKRSIRLMNFIGDHLQTKVVPVGPRFQAAVPDWNGPMDRTVLIASYRSDSDTSKWLGSRVWPIEIGNTKTACRKIGKGRRDSCSCASPGSADCIKRHILKERLILKCDLGPAFFSWKFNEMGEQVSKLWLAKEQQTMESLVKRRSSSNGKSFWNRALKCLPNKDRKDIVNYFFNVYVPHRMSLQTRSLSIEQVNTDDEDESENLNYLGSQKRSKGRTHTVSNTTKARYLCSS